MQYGRGADDLHALGVLCPTECITNGCGFVRTGGGAICIRDFSKQLLRHTAALLYHLRCVAREVPLQHLEDAPWPATKDELIDYAIRSGAPIEVIENLQELEDEGEVYEGLEDIWPDYPSQDDFFFNEDEY